MDIFDLTAKLTLDKSDYESGISEVQNNSSNFGSTMATAGKVALGGIVAVGTAVAGLTGSVVNATSDLAEYGDNIDKSSQKLGVSAQFYQEWDAVLQHSGTSMDSMSATFKKLATASQDATDDQKEAFKQLGLSMEQVSNMSTEELFTSVITGLQGMEEGTQRTALATDLLGKGAMEMGALLNTSAEDTQAMIDTVNELGGVLSDEAVKNAAHFEDSLQDLQTALKGTKNGIISDFLPSVNNVLDGLTKIFSGDNGGGLSQINQGITQFVNNLSNSIPKIAEVGTSIIRTLAEAIVANLPQLMETGTTIVMDIANMIIDNLPELAQTALQIIITIADGITQSLPELIPTIVDVVLEITDTLINNADLLIDGAIALILGLTEGIINALPKLIEKAPEIIIKLADAIVRNAPKIVKGAVEMVVQLAKGFVDNFPKFLAEIPALIIKIAQKIIELKSKMVDAGAQIVAGLWDGIKANFDKMVDNFVQSANNMVSKVKGALGIHSPSTVFANIGEMCVAGLEEGSDGLFTEDGITATVSANVEDKATGTNDSVLELLQAYLPQIASGNNIVLDTGALVGGTVKAYNEELGRLSLRGAYT